MAIKKTIMSRSGYPLEYWKIGDWHISPTHSLMEINLIPYVNSTTRTDGLDPVMEEIRKIRVTDRVNRADESKSTYVYRDYFSPSAIEQAGVSIYQMMYDYIKNEVPEFEGAENI